MPELKAPLESCEKIDKQYDAGMLFLTSIRVFADFDASALARAYLNTAVKNDAQIQMYRRSYDKEFELLVRGFSSIDVAPQVASPYWDDSPAMAWVPRRLQRLHRLASIEEASNFFRIPIPVRTGFPGFGYDTGLGENRGDSRRKGVLRIGSYLDVAGKQETASFDSQQFAKHGLIVGVPGSGKTTAVFNILHQLWDAPPDERVPFIVLEPAKTEYRALLTLPAFRDDMLVFTLGDESVSPFRFNPMEVLPGIRLESHISRLQACFVGAFDLFDPLPIFLEQAIRRTYSLKGWYEDSRGGEMGLETPTLTDLCASTEFIVENSGFDDKMRSDFKASLLERLNSLRRGSKGRMLDTPKTMLVDDLMGRPVILELDSLNADEKSLVMMFLLTYVFEYCKAFRTSGSSIKHLLMVEEAHNLISSSGSGSDDRANPREHTIELFVNMLAEMRSLGQGILIADQLPTAIASQAVKQTNVKMLMRMTARDDREEIGNTMDLDAEQMHQVVNFKTGHAYLYHEGEDHVRMIRMVNFKGEHDVEEPPSDSELAKRMAFYEEGHLDLYRPYPECATACGRCDRRTRSQAEQFVRTTLLDPGADPYTLANLGDPALRSRVTLCPVVRQLASREAERIRKRYGSVSPAFGRCVAIHMARQAASRMDACYASHKNKCPCDSQARSRHRDSIATVTNQ